MQFQKDYLPKKSNNICESCVGIRYKVSLIFFTQSLMSNIIFFSFSISTTIWDKNKKAKLKYWLAVVVHKQKGFFIHWSGRNALDVHM